MGNGEKENVFEWLERAKYSELDTLKWGEISIGSIIDHGGKRKNLGGNCAIYYLVYDWT